MHDRKQPKPPLSRRRFLKGASLAAAGFAAPTIVSSRALGRDGNIAPSNRIVMGVVGSGLQGTSNMRSFLGKKDQVQIIAIADVDNSHAAEAKGLVDKAYGNNDCVTTQEFREVTRRDDIDAVLIATPDHWHCLCAIDAAKHAKDCYVQKPLAFTIEEGRVLSDIVTRHARVLQTGSQQRSDWRFRTACEMAINGRVGKLQHIAVGIPNNNRQCEATWQPQPIPEGFDYDRWLGPAPYAPYHEQRCHYQFRFLLDYSGGQVTNFGAHNLDIAQWGMQADDTGPVEFWGDGDFPATGLFTTATRVNFAARYANGVLLTCRTGDFSMSFIGDAGTIHVSRSSISTEPASLLKDPIGANEIRLEESKDHFQNFLDCVRARRQPICNAEVGHRTSAVCNLGNIAMLLGRRLKWDPKAERVIGDDEANRMLSRPTRAPWCLEDFA